MIKLVVGTIGNRPRPFVGHRLVSCRTKVSTVIVITPERRLRLPAHLNFSVRVEKQCIGCVWICIWLSYFLYLWTTNSDHSASTPTNEYDKRCTHYTVALCFTITRYNIWLLTMWSKWHIDKATSFRVSDRNITADYGHVINGASSAITARRVVFCHFKVTLYERHSVQT